MTYLRSVILYSIVSSSSVLAADKGFFFKIGEKFLNLSGHSYVALEKKFYAFETEKTQCMNDVSKLSTQISEREKDSKIVMLMKALKQFRQIEG